MIGERIHWFESIDSTNDYVLKNHDKLHDGDVVVALEQSSGRGRHGRKWHSPRGGLWFSLVFKPRRFRDPNFYTKLVSVSIVQVLKELGLKVVIKWPNDIVFSGKKLAGVLTEGVYEGMTPLVVVVGVGLNVNNDLPDDLKHRAVSLKDILGHEIPIDELLEKILKRIRSNRKKYSSSPGALTRVWKSLLNLKEGQKVMVNGEEGVIERIHPDRIVLKLNRGRFELFDGDGIHEIYTQR